MARLIALFATIGDIVRLRVVDLANLSLNLDNDTLFEDLHHGRS
jgi:hypothetical protein